MHRARERQPRTVHHVGNISVSKEEEAQIRVNSVLQVIEWRNERQRVWGALVEHHLRPAGDSFRIAHKRVDLVNSEGELDGISILF
jgi:3-phenylpropionate/cinnamic acid dioxygenase small subunit